MKGIMVPEEMEEWIEPLSDEERGKLLTAILAYARRQEKIELTGGERYVFYIVKESLDDQRLKKEAVSRARSEAGKKGGRPPKNKKAKKANAFSEKQKKHLLLTEDETPAETAGDGKSDTKRENTQPSAELEQPIYHIPLISGESFEVTPSFLAHQAELFPAVDVESEIRKMIGWCESKPTRRKTKSGIRSFINSWLSRAQDKGGQTGGGNVAPVWSGKPNTPYKNALLDYAIQLEQEEGANRT